MARIDEIAPNVFRISSYVPQIDLQFNHFLIKDDDPLLFHTGMRRMFPEIRDAVARLIDPASLRWISWSHFETDECGALNDWLQIAPRAQAACSQVGALVNIEDFAARPPRGLSKDDVIETGQHRFRYIPTPHLPHGWDAGVLFEEHSGLLLCSDLFHQTGDREPLTTDDVVARWGDAVSAYQAHPILMDYMPYTPATRSKLEQLAALNPKMLAAMHGSSFVGDGAAALRAGADMMEQQFGCYDRPHDAGQHVGAASVKA
jgi:flavorubredoxin